MEAAFNELPSTTDPVWRVMISQFRDEELTPCSSREMSFQSIIEREEGWLVSL